MPKKLILVRHAKAVKDVPGLKDFDRPLNDKGSQDAPRMGKQLFDRGIKPDAWISSPSERTKMTAELFGEQFKIELDTIIYNENIFEGSARILLNVINEFNDLWNTVILFGHNPGISYLAEFLTKAEIGDMPTSGIVSVDFDINSWKEVSGSMGKLDFFVYPQEN